MYCLFLSFRRLLLFLPHHLNFVLLQCSPTLTNYPFHLLPTSSPHLLLLLDSSVLFPQTCTESGLNKPRRCWKPNVLGFVILEISASVLKKYSLGMFWYLGSFKNCLFGARSQRPQLAFSQLWKAVRACIFSDSLYDTHCANSLTLWFIFFHCTIKGVLYRGVSSLP